MTSQSVPPTQAAYELSTFDGFQSELIRLLKQEGAGAALVDATTQSFLFLDNEELCNVELIEGDDLTSPKGIYCLDDACIISPAAWSGDSWTISTAMETQKLIREPQFVRLSFIGELQRVQCIGGHLSISDDDICSDCTHCTSQGDSCTCSKEWPGYQDDSGYVQKCMYLTIATL